MRQLARTEVLQVASQRASLKAGRSRSSTALALSSSVRIARMRSSISAGSFRPSSFSKNRFKLLYPKLSSGRDLSAMQRISAACKPQLNSVHRYYVSTVLF